MSGRLVTAATRGQSGRPADAARRSASICSSNDGVAGAGASAAVVVVVAEGGSHTVVLVAAWNQYGRPPCFALACCVHPAGKGFSAAGAAIAAADGEGAGAPAPAAGSSHRRSPVLSLNQYGRWCVLEKHLRQHGAAVSAAGTSNARFMPRRSGRCAPPFIPLIARLMRSAGGGMPGCRQTAKWIHASLGSVESEALIPDSEGSMDADGVHF